MAVYAKYTGWIYLYDKIRNALVPLRIFYRKVSNEKWAEDNVNIENLMC